MKVSIQRIAWACTLVAVLAAPAAAQDTQTEEAKWQSLVGLFGGYHAVEGTNQSGDFTYDVDTRSGDLEWIFGLYAMGWKNRWGGIFETSWLTEEYDNVLYEDRSVILTGTLEQTLFDVEGFAFFSIFGAEKQRPLDVLAGARYFFSRTTVGLFSNQTQFQGMIDTTNTVSNSWIDPTIGVRLSSTRTAKFWAMIRGDVGGFGVGSDMSWQVRALASIRLSNTFDLGFAVKVTDVDYDNGKTGIDHYATNATHGNFLLTALFRLE
jgi:hypothetical protein